MIGFLPSPLPDEFFYSLIARYKSISGNPNEIVLLRDLKLARGELKCIVLTPTAEIIRRTIPECWISDQEISKLTFESYAFTFRSPPKPTSRSKSATVKVAIGHFYGRLYYCPDCAEADQTQYSTTYWRRNHQIPGVLVCPLHRCFLQSIHVEKANFFQLPPSQSRLPVEYIRMSEPSHRLLLLLAEDCASLLESPLIDGHARLTIVVKESCKDLGLTKNKLGINRLAEVLLQTTYSKELLELFDFRRCEPAHASWMVNFTSATAYFSPTSALLCLYVFGRRLSALRFNTFEDLQYPSSILMELSDRKTLIGNLLRIDITRPLDISEYVPNREKLLLKRWRISHHSDIDLECRIEDACTALRNNFSRITHHEIAQFLGISYGHLFTIIDKNPNLDSIIKCHIETGLEFQKRRMKNKIESLRTQGTDPTFELVVERNFSFTNYRDIRNIYDSLLGERADGEPGVSEP